LPCNRTTTMHTWRHGRYINTSSDTQLFHLGTGKCCNSDTHILEILLTLLRGYGNFF